MLLLVKLTVSFRERSILGANENPLTVINEIEIMNEFNALIFGHA